ncbi:MAG: lycopene cyclase domain-containing protein [Actinobacteria bacterium]|nr:lycopene cyclase domain-containing protein [Actinomycetota bacterium]MCB9412278.1 lycopene cyclase domain-containing protein [Actinomycetota bacterium]
MEKFSYLGVLLFVIVGTVWLELVVHTRVYRRWRRLLLAILPAAAIFVVWDLYAISREHWWFDPTRITGVYFPGSLPIDELLFFLIIPLAAILTLEAVRGVKRWQVGDEPPGSVVDGIRVEDR